MSRRPVLETVDDDDIDNMDMDIAEFDPNLNTPIAPLRPQPSVVRSQDQTSKSPVLDIERPEDYDKDIRDPRQFSDSEKREFKSYQTIYPCYFDINRSHQSGRRVSKELAVSNPLAKTIADPCRFLRIPVLLELDKSHPQDFGNPGRVKLLIKKDGQQVDELINNKRQVMNSIAKYLKQHPTTLESIGLKSGHPIPPEYKDGFEPEELPRVKGFEMNTIVPIHSQLTMKHPMTKHIYDPEPEQPKIPAAPKAPKKKVMKIRG